MILLLFSCSATTVHEDPPRLEDRTLLLSREGAWFEYPYYKTICEFPDRLIFKNCTELHVIEKYDLNDRYTREKLIDTGFIFQSKQRFQY